MCGEKALRALRFLPQLGSPPHVRGKVSFQIVHHIPIWDHPRMCGEKHEIVEIV